MQDEIRQWFVTIFANELDKGLCGERFPHLESRQAILSKRIIEIIRNYLRRVRKKKGSTTALRAERETYCYPRLVTIVLKS